MAGPYLLMTGATGLLGEYLVRDLLRAGVPLAVIVRGTKRLTAADRMETICRRWEERDEAALPRPVVLTGTLDEPGLGLSDQEREWVARSCEAVLHNAASINFQHNERTGEPERSNIGGTRHVLEMMRSLGLTRLHHVSTAYVCGLVDRDRGESLITESDLDRGQTFGNPYERSKFVAESMVRAACRPDAVAPPPCRRHERSHQTDSPELMAQAVPPSGPTLTELTIYRPAIIVGDSFSGYTSTYHGFYAPLKSAHAISEWLPGGEITPEALLEVTGTANSDAKNFVPVDWVSRAMAFLITHPSSRGGVYHLTPGTRTPLGLMASVMHDEIGRDVLANAAARTAKAPSDRPESLALENVYTFFTDQLAAYAAYWRDDPVFDQSAFLRLAPHLPCPVLDGEALRRLCRWAISRKFLHAPPLPPVAKESSVKLVCDGGQRLELLGPTPAGTRHLGNLTPSTGSDVTTWDVACALATGQTTWDEAIEAGAVARLTASA